MDFHDLQATALCEHLTDADLAEFCQHSKDKVLTPNQTVYRLGERVYSSYLILEGSVLVFIPDRLGNPIMIDRLKAGDIFGELIDSAEVVCTSTAVTTAQTHLLILDRSSLYFLFAKKPEAALIVMKALNKHLQRIQSLLKISRASRT